MNGIELLFAWTNRSYNGPPISGGISSYAFGLKVDLSNLSPSLWTFDSSSSHTDSQCSNWVEVPTSCVHGTRYLQLEGQVVLYAIQLRLDFEIIGNCNMYASGYRTRPYSMGVLNGLGIGIVNNLQGQSNVMWPINIVFSFHSKMLLAV